MRILLITNDFPPRVGGIQVYLDNIYRRLAARHDVTVFAPAHPGDVGYDAQQPFEIVRHPGRVYWPTSSIGRRARALASRADVVAFGAVVPMNLIGRRLDRPVVVHTHGFEVAWARLPALRQALRSIGRHASLVTVVSEYCRRYIEDAIAGQEQDAIAGHAPRLEMLKTGVDLDAFNPDVDGGEVRKRFGLEGRPVVACISRLVARKGQDQIIKALPAVLREVPDAAVLLVGGGPRKNDLQRLAVRTGVAERVVFAGEVPWHDLPPAYAAADVFAMPARSRLSGLEVEGLGLVYLEAQACGRPAITGDSGGAPEAVIPGRTGLVVPGLDTSALSRAIVQLLGDPAAAAAMGAAGRRMVQDRHRWDDVVTRYEAMLQGIR